MVNILDCQFCPWLLVASGICCFAGINNRFWTGCPDLHSFWWQIQTIMHFPVLVKIPLGEFEKYSDPSKALAAYLSPHESEWSWWKLGGAYSGQLLKKKTGEPVNWSNISEVDLSLMEQSVDEKINVFWLSTQEYNLSQLRTDMKHRFYQKIAVIVDQNGWHDCESGEILIEELRKTPKATVVFVVECGI